MRLAKVGDKIKLWNGEEGTVTSLDATEPKTWFMFSSPSFYNLIVRHKWQNSPPRAWGEFAFKPAGPEPRALKVGDRIRLVNPEQLYIYSLTHVAGSVHTVEALGKGTAKIGPYSINKDQYVGKFKIWEFADEETKEEIEVTPQGGKHTAIGRAYHHFPPHAMRLMAETLHKGALKYNRPYDVMNWKNISKEDHHNHALNHIFLALENNETEDYVNAALRCIMALQMHLEEKNG